VSGPLAWNLQKLALDRAWARTTGRADIVVAVIDGMPDLTHEALAGRWLVPMSDDLVFCSDRSISSHATNVCGVVAGQSHLLSGVAPGVRLLPLVVDLNTQVYAERADAIRFAAQCARAGRVGMTPFSRLILSCSWRTRGDMAVIRTAVADAISAGVLVLFSAGNEETDLPHYPSDYAAASGLLGEGTVCVAATDEDDRKASYSNYSSKVDVSAPGGDGLPLDLRDILCADQGGTYVYSAGTSIAAPHVAGVAALILSLRPSLTPRELKAGLRAAVDSIDGLNSTYVHKLGTGRLNAEKALAAVAAMPSDSEALSDGDGYTGGGGSSGGGGASGSWITSAESVPQTTRGPRVVITVTSATQMSRSMRSRRVGRSVEPASDTAPAASATGAPAQRQAGGTTDVTSESRQPPPRRRAPRRAREPRRQA
jgi:subtilisin family serine protease